MGRIGGETKQSDSKRVTAWESDGQVDGAGEKGKIKKWRAGRG